MTLVPTDQSGVSMARRMKRSWIKKARRRLKMVHRGQVTKQSINDAMAKHPRATVREIQDLVQQATGLRFDEGSKYKFFMHTLLQNRVNTRGKQRKVGLPPSSRRFRLCVVAGEAASESPKEERSAEAASESPKEECSALVPFTWRTVLRTCIMENSGVGLCDRLWRPPSGLQWRRPLLPETSRRRAMWSAVA